MSEILARAAPGGTSVEPAFELVDEGLAARVDLDPARRSSAPTCRSSTSPPSAAAVARAERDLGHLQAFGLRPIGDLEARLVHEADWANAWKAHFPVLRIGRRIVIRPTWRRHRREPGDVVLALDPGMAFGTGLHPTTRLCLAALESMADRGLLGGRRATDGRRACSTSAAAPGSSRSPPAPRREPVLARRRRPDRGRGDARERAPQRARAADPAREGSSPAARARSTSSLANLIASLLVALADGLVADLRPGGTLLASGIFENREADVVAAFDGPRPGSRAAGPRATGSRSEVVRRRA